MPNHNTSATALKNSMGGTPTYKYLNRTHLLGAQFIHDFAKKICKVRNYSYLCDARSMQPASQSTYSERDKALPFVHFCNAVVSVSQTDRGNASFCTYLLNF